MGGGERGGGVGGGDDDGGGGGGGGGRERDARCWPLVVTEAGKDNRRRHMAGEESGQKSENKAALRARGPQAHRHKHLQGLSALHLDRKTARRAY